MDNDIIKRAKEYADRHQSAELNYFGLGKVYGYTRIYNAELTAYERGAKEQKSIDFERWLKAARNVLTEDSLKAFRKAIEEEE